LRTRDRGAAAPRPAQIRQASAALRRRAAAFCAVASGYNAAHSIRVFEEPPMSDLETFRADVQQWLAQNAPASLRGAPGGDLDGVWGGRKARYENPDRKRWLDACAERGFTAPEWPKQYGGGGLSRDEAKALRQELA
jgi:hypothetical protein